MNGTETLTQDSELILRRLVENVPALGLVFPVAFAFLVLFLEIIRRAGPVFFAQFNYLAVLAGVAWGAAIFGERLSIYVIVAMVLMFVGVFLSGYRRPSTTAAPSKPAG